MTTMICWLQTQIILALTVAIATMTRHPKKKRKKKMRTAKKQTMKKRRRRTATMKTMNYEELLTNWAIPTSNPLLSHGIQLFLLL
ncbi:hypothetical protein K450DRAFT_256762 [Umbelopsis ramanniana AG]|uniref:Uncharacterized protein n=1 Tax=Umbelopsis ramanniana AG TaxID=1314678 RepID=A0AAD5HBQ7_UMBRA|nr:uncharacterized protein K450DRAFT_256762 [Umbelopsis ramanniana AG]KAI8576438.1 hypothetical protein K450DRAFT_256762 [Umbelopsis ramanniana AG]